MTSIDVPRNTSQQLSQSFGINVKLVSPAEFYTCPTGKRATVKGIASCDSTGTAATVRLIVGAVGLAKWISLGGDDNINFPQSLSLNFVFPFEIQLNAGQSIQYTQDDAGTNSSMSFNASIQELIAA